MRATRRHLLHFLSLAFGAFACCTKQEPPPKAKVEHPRHPTKAWYDEHRSKLNGMYVECDGYFVKATSDNKPRDIRDSVILPRKPTGPTIEEVLWKEHGSVQVECRLVSEYRSASAHAVLRKQDQELGKNMTFDANRNEWVAIPDPPLPPVPNTIRPLNWIRYVPGKLDLISDDSYYTLEKFFKPTVVCQECRERQGDRYPWAFVKISDLR